MSKINKVKNKISRVLFPLAAFTMLAAQPAMAKTIKYVQINVDADMVEGMPFGDEDIDVSSKNTNVEVNFDKIDDIGTPDSKSDDDEDTADDGLWHYGYQPTLTLTLNVDDEKNDTFKLNGRNDVKLTGTAEPEFVSISKADKSKTATLKVKLKALKNRAASAYNVKFKEYNDDGYFVDLNVPDGNTYYKVKLFHDNDFVAEYKTEPGDKELEVTDGVRESGKYTLEVKMFNDKDDTYSRWVKPDTSLKAEQEDIDAMINATANFTDGSDRTANNEGRWILDNKGWWYQTRTGAYPKAKWREVNNAMYYFDQSGYAVTGWKRMLGNNDSVNSKTGPSTPADLIKGNVNDGLSWFYFDPTSCAMQKGWKFIDNAWYYLGNDGKMRTNTWIKSAVSNEIWYFVGADGKMLANTTTPDGHVVNANGQWLGVLIK